MTDENMEQATAEEQDAAKIEEIHNQLRHAAWKAADQTFEQILTGEIKTDDIGIPDFLSQEINVTFTEQTVQNLLLKNIISQLIELKLDSLESGDEHRISLVNSVLKEKNSEELFTEINGFFIYQNWHINHAGELQNMPEEEREKTMRFIERLSSFLTVELHKSGLDVSADDLSKELDLKGRPVKGAPHADLIRKAINAAKTEGKDVYNVTAKPGDKYFSPFDKASASLFDNFEEILASKEAYPIAAEKRGSKKEINIMIFAEFTKEVSPGIAGKLTPTDRRIYNAVSSLWREGNEVVTASQIWAKAGHTARPNSKQLKKVNDSITKLSMLRVKLDNSQEAAAYKYNKFIYDGYMLPMERVTAYVNGQLCESAIHLFREPPLATFAISRNQFGEIPDKVLQSPVDQTDTTVAIEEYLLTRIIRMKHSPKTTRKILYSTVYQNCNISSATTPEQARKKRQRVREYVSKFLDYYMETKFIKSYTANNDGVVISP